MNKRLGLLGCAIFSLSIGSALAADPAKIDWSTVPVNGKNGYVDLRVQAAYDDKNAYLRFQWKTLNPYPGTEHQYLRFDGQRDLPKTASRQDANANALLAAIKKNDLRKFLPATRTNPGDWTTGRSLEDIAKLKAVGGFVDLIQWRAHRSDPVGMTDDGYVLEYRNSDAGKNMFGGNADSKTHQPKFMWDAKKVGYKSITADQLRKGPHFLIREQNAVHDDNITTRGHHVSFVKTLGFGVKADITAVKLP